MYIHVDELERQIIKVIKELDFDNLAEVAGELLGGECHYQENDMFSFEPNEDYGGAFE